MDSSCPKCGKVDVIDDLCGAHEKPLIHCTKCGDVTLDGYPFEYGGGLTPDGVSKIFGGESFSVGKLVHNSRYEELTANQKIKIFSLRAEIFDLEDLALKEIRSYNPVYVTSFQLSRKLADFLNEYPNPIPMTNSMNIVSLNGERSGVNVFDNHGIVPMATNFQNSQHTVDRLRTVFGLISKNIGKKTVIVTFNLPHFSSFSSVLARALASDCSQEIIIIVVSKTGMGAREE